MPGCAFTFELPFLRRDVWREMNAPQQLGVHPSVSVVDEAKSSSSVLDAPHARTYSCDDTTSAVRTVSHGKRRTVSRLISSSDDEQSSFQIWEVTEQEGCLFTFFGGSSGGAPRTSVHLTDVLASGSSAGRGASKVGCSVTLGFDFDRLESARHGWCGWLRRDAVSEFRACFDGVAEAWGRSMLERGHVPVATLRDCEA